MGAMMDYSRYWVYIVAAIIIIALIVLFVTD
ncbi:MAG: hypothetical protein K0S99_453 [Thermomicrobiales bacterium]|nr:hypothetical protein [Thermomicrobiales bacterium]